MNPCHQPFVLPYNFSGVLLDPNSITGDSSSSSRNGISILTDPSLMQFYMENSWVNNPILLSTALIAQNYTPLLGINNYNNLVHISPVTPTGFQNNANQVYLNTPIKENNESNNIICTKIDVNSRETDIVTQIETPDRTFLESLATASVAATDATNSTSGGKRKRETSIESTCSNETSLPADITGYETSNKASKVENNKVLPIYPGIQPIENSVTSAIFQSYCYTLQQQLAAAVAANVTTSSETPCSTPTALSSNTPCFSPINTSVQPNMNELHLPSIIANSNISKTSDDEIQIIDDRQTPFEKILRIHSSLVGSLSWLPPKDINHTILKSSEYDNRNDQDKENINEDYDPFKQRKYDDSYVTCFSPRMLPDWQLNWLRDVTRSLPSVPKSPMTGIHFDRTKPAWAVSYYECETRKYYFFFIPDLSQNTVEITLAAAIGCRQNVVARGAHKRKKPGVLTFNLYSGQFEKSNSSNSMNSFSQNRGSNIQNITNPILTHNLFPILDPNYVQNSSHNNAALLYAAAFMSGSSPLVNFETNSESTNNNSIGEQMTSK
ncbi:hypothetical protein ACR3K2_34240 [Cryptosporidium serpentis]